MKNTNPTISQDIDRQGQYFSHQLTLATSDLSHDISERLRVARQLALAQRKPMVLSRLSQIAQLNSNSTLTGPADDGLNLLNILASSLPILALVFGLMAIQWVQQDSIISEIAATDSALLTDELPPDAYTDAGFSQFLKLGLSANTKDN
ncbi:hypothetical protein B9Z45_09455 [Limnohabitans sp. 2KL-17]|uniref:DUF3619 family protein n=1 Tax=Limnohabitans sp. 2KL-17 TaxID=1100704 RepID=UPI000D360D2E|nr:DUF3619 family protein [Limnohabitans sp. 2KL-17]PUE56841.1 hypothetical protein B9Z45_09455 [Limnohabitans sp. 2KL-17]